MKMKTVWLDELTMPEAKEAAEKGKIVILPVGSVEEHGRHLPLCTDSLQPENIAVEVAKKVGCLVAPALRYGVSLISLAARYTIFLIISNTFL